MNTDPIELSAIDRGAGPPVALVHGGVFHAAPAWARQIGPLVEGGYRSIAVDRRGHGRSPPGDSFPVSVHLHADDLRLTLELRDVAHAHLVGVSYGALVCLEFALSWPERVISMTFLEPPLFTWLSDEPDYKEWYDKFIEIAHQKDALALEEWMPHWLGLIDSSMARSLTPESPAWGIVEKQALLIFEEEPGWEYRPDVEEIETLRVPSLILSGDQSEPPMQLIAEMLADRLPDSRHRSIPGGGHDAHARTPELFNTALLSFLEAMDQRRKRL
jgi:pimeloyl-ACP methyl ester carboxylesterase